MLSPRMLLVCLLGSAVAAGGLLQGGYWKRNAAGDRASDSLKAAQEEIASLKKENAALRSLAQGGGEFSVSREWIDMVEKDYGMEFLSAPVVHRIAWEELHDRVAAALEYHYGPSGIDDRQEAWRLLGLLDKEDQLLQHLAAVKSVGALGWFDETSGEAWVTDRFNLEEIPDQAALVRLLTRVLLHQRFPPVAGYPGDEAARAREAVHVGVAAGAEARFLAKSARSLGFLQMNPNLAAKQVFDTLPPFLKGITTFPVVEGKTLADSAYVSGGDALVAMLRKPPVATAGVFFPEKSTSREIELPEFAEEPYLVENMGMLGLKLWLSQYGGTAAGAAWADWLADRYALVPDGDSSAAVYWEIELASEQSADVVAAAALAMVKSLAGKEAAVGEVAEGGDGRFFGVSRVSKTRVRFLNGATREWVGKMRIASDETES